MAIHSGRRIYFSGTNCSSTNAFATPSRSNGFQFQVRYQTLTLSYTYGVADPSFSAPTWVKLRRAGIPADRLFQHERQQVDEGRFDPDYHGG